ncbi:DUF300-domain-containing protein [Pleurostoma richardsiae]|uniref:DUF300-domain-containing protein n=1 Tax=Pleurostoma richardsiae TaxID=41990 RepID=A0AA38VJJ2_9PEZI|nr:DUF300-domain-containing protein [Pleurostoma richardsiae]
MNLTCNATLEEMRILPGSETPIAGSLTFHQLALIIAGASTLVAIVLSFYLIWMHALNYTKPREQKHIIRILFMVPVYAASSFLQLRFYYHAVYYQVISDCYEAFAISSFFALLCHYLAPDLHEQKEFFRHMQPIKPWVLPLNWFKACCGGERGPWRTPRSGLTWFNIIWIGIYHYCFIRVAMTITAVVTQYFDRYCESSNSPVFSHIWVIAINCIAVTIAMYCVIQFYVQLKGPLAEHQPFLKVLAIKLVIFLSFWQTIAISVGTSQSINIVHATETIAYPDVKVGIPALLLCFEMALFALLHLWAFPYRPYTAAAKPTFYPSPSPDSSIPPRESEKLAPAGGFLGLKAIWDSANLWDVVKAFGRGIRWLFVGVKHREEDVSYHGTGKSAAAVDLDDMSMSPPQKTSSGRLDVVDTAYGGGGAAPFGMHRKQSKSTDHLPIATEFRRSRFDMMHSGGRQQAQQQGRMGTVDAAAVGTGDIAAEGRIPNEESAGLIAHAQPNPGTDRRREDDDMSPERYRQQYQPPPPQQQQQQRQQYQNQYYDSTGVTPVEEEEEPYYGAPGQAEWAAARAPRNPRNSRQLAVGQALWGPRTDRGGGGGGGGGGQPPPGAI